SQAFVWYSGDQEIGRWAGNNVFTFGTNTQASQQIILNAASGTTSYMRWQTAGSERWRVQFTRNETGSNAGMDMTWQRYDDTGALLDNAFYIRRSDAAATLYGTLAVQGGTFTLGLSTTTSPVNSITINAQTTGRNRRILWQTAGSARWAFGMVNNETGSGNVG